MDEVGRKSRSNSAEKLRESASRRKKELFPTPLFSGCELRVFRLTSQALRYEDLPATRSEKINRGPIEGSVRRGERRKTGTDNLRAVRGPVSFRAALVTND